MSKLNVYVDEGLRSQLDEYKLEVSKICQEALWGEIQKLVDRKCVKCGKKAKWMLISEGFEPDYACDTHLVGYLETVTVVRRLNNGQAGAVKAS